MESLELGEPLDVRLDRSNWDVPVTLPARRFRTFSQKIDRQLARLVWRWGHLSAPNAQRLSHQCDGTKVP